MISLQQLAQHARHSASGLAETLSGDKDRALEGIATALEQNTQTLLAANRMDLEQAERDGMNAAMVDRLRLTQQRIAGIAGAVRHVRSLEDPVGRILDGHTTPDGLRITRIAVPFGVVGIIYESRPNVTVDCAALCLKSGNACILRGGKEAIHSNTALVEVIRGALAGAGLDANCVQLVEDLSRETSTAMMRANGLIDVLIPRGGAGLISQVVQNATVPVIETGTGNCHIFVDATAELQMAVDIIDNAKTSRPSVCNAAETLLVHRDCADTFLPLAAARLWHKQVQLRGCDETRRILGERVLPATEEDFAAEFGDFILAVRVVESLDEAIKHIAKYSTHHSEAIVTRDMQSARAFTARVDSAAVYVNASTRFTDGGEFGLGAEIGISTQKLHARGPMGLTHLVSYKYIIQGDGQIRV